MCETTTTLASNDANVWTLARELAHVCAERDAADRACAALEREVDALRQQLAHADADNAALIQRCRMLRRQLQEVCNG